MSVLRETVAALAGVGGLVLSAYNARNNKKNTQSVESLEQGKLDLSVAEFGVGVLLSLIEELKAEVRECDEERIYFRDSLIQAGILPGKETS